MTTTGATTPAVITRLRSVTFITFVLRFAEPGGVTVPGQPDRDGPWGRGRAHLVLDRDAWGQPQLPGTSLGGALREMVHHRLGPDRAETLFGCLRETGAGGADVDARASRVWVLGSRLVHSAGTGGSQIRASTAISRRRGAARVDTLRVDEVLPAGSRFEVFLRWDDAARNDLDEVLGLLAAWRPFIGRGVSRGRGRCTTQEIRHGTLHLNRPDDLLRWLTSSGPELARAVATQEVPVDDAAAGPDLLLRVTMRITGPWRVGSGEPAPKVADADGEHEVIPILREDDRYLLPGAGLKGLLRSRSEYVLRSVGITPPPCLDQRCGECWTCRVFGYGAGPGAGAEAVGRRSAVRVTDTYVDGSPPVVRRAHVAIDRFTGGALPHALYEVEALDSGTFDVQVEQLGGIGESGLREIRAVLRLVLQDVHDGIVGVGAGTARGYGSVTVDLEEAEKRGWLPSVTDARRELARMVERAAVDPDGDLPALGEEQ